MLGLPFAAWYGRSAEGVPPSEGGGLCGELGAIATAYRRWIEGSRSGLSLSGEWSVSWGPWPARVASERDRLRTVEVDCGTGIGVWVFIGGCTHLTACRMTH